jgi:hypothetical protein
MQPALLRSCILAAGLFVLPPPARAADPLAKYDASIKPADRAHWAFQPVQPLRVPAVKDGAWLRNPIDAFVLARLEARGWKPAAAASGRVLLRRIYLDLLGLPPTPEEQQAFLGDTRPDAWERLVDRLLASPAYGERWGRHWLDVVRYADTNGYERDADKPGAWKYRDWVIRALNADTPYDRLVLEQLAGDELPHAGTDSVLATGFLRLGPWDDEPADPKADRFDQLDDLVSVTAEAFLGLTLACGRCHNHKFEPLTMHDYYRMVAVFAPLDRPRRGRTELDRPAVPPARRAEMSALLARFEHLQRLDRAGALVGLLGSAELRRRREQMRAQACAVPRGYFLEEHSPVAPVTHLLRRGSASQPGPRVEPGVPAVLAPRQPAFLPLGKYTSRRRRSLARWIASKDNPLTARVIVNRVWMHHLGQALVRTPGDFGRRGERPTHPELLDWLAGWFVDSGWSLKALHRLILTSSTYRMSRAWREDYAREDPDNRLLWRFAPRRLEAEAIRDSILAASGRLDRAMFGPGVRPAIQKAALEGHSDPATVWKADPPEKAERRTVYVHVKRSLLVPLVECLDLCDTTRSSGRRTVTTVAPQALMLFNGDFVNEQAAHLARRLRREAGADLDKQIDRAYRLVLCRPPTPREREMLRGYLDRQRKAGLKDDKARQQVCRVLLNLNELVYPD